MMKGFLLTFLLLSTSFYGYSFGIGLQHGGFGVEFVVGYTHYTQESKVWRATSNPSTTQGVLKNSKAEPHLYLPSVFRKIGLTMAFGSIENPLLFWGINYYTNSTFTHNDANMLLQGNWVKSQNFAIETALDYRWYTYNITPCASFYVNGGLGSTFFYYRYQAGLEEQDSWSTPGIPNRHHNSSTDIRNIYLDIYARLPLGVNMKAVNHLEFFTEASLDLGLRILAFNNYSNTDQERDLYTGVIGKVTGYNHILYQNTAQFIGGLNLMFGLRYWIGAG